MCHEWGYGWDREDDELIVMECIRYQTSIYFHTPLHRVSRNVEPPTRMLPDMLLQTFYAVQLKHDKSPPPSASYRFSG